MITKMTLGAGVAALVLLGAGGTAWAQSASSTAPTQPAQSQTQQAQHAKKHHGLLSRIEHGEATLATKKGDQVVDVQRGEVTAVSPNSVTVKSKDGFTGTYTVAPASKVHKTGKLSNIGEVKPGDRVGVVAVKTGGTDTVRQLHDPGPAKH